MPPTRLRRTRYRASSLTAESEVEPLAKLWILRALVPLGGHQQFVGETGFSNDALARTLGLGDWVDEETCEYDRRAVRAALRLAHRESELRFASAEVPACLRSNVSRLARLVGLTPVEARIIELAVLLRTDSTLEEASECLGDLPSVRVSHVVSALLNLPERDVRAALQPQGTLNQSGLIKIDRSMGSMQLRNKLDLLSDEFADIIASSEVDPLTLLRDIVSPSAPATLSLGEFDHLEPSLTILLPYLKHALASCRRGVNVLCHGAPGTGKTELARLLAAQLGCELFQVTSENGDGDPIDGEDRLRGFRAAQSFFGQSTALFVFDEVEDVFDDGDHFFRSKSTAQASKAWINRMLEDNAVPTVWLSNSIRCLDRAFIRRFDMVLEMPVPPRKQRARIIERSCDGLLDARAIERLAESETLAPAIVTRAASVVRSIGDQLGPQQSAAAVELLVCSTLQAQGHASIPRNDPTQLPEVYDPAFVNADSDLSRVAAGLARTRTGRLCLYGPPGTGKTAFARWLAASLGVPLLVRRASDILSKWVGEDEKNIARAFRQAEQQGALLLLDEVDSFLQDRRGAAQSWQVTLVNEMLTQMESFAGVFVASTNLMQGLDQASLRRFDLKLKFGFLQPRQAWDLLGRHCAALGMAAPAPSLEPVLARLGNLTPGDFAAVVRQHRIRSLESAAALVAALQAECALKEGAKARIGFH